MVKDVNGHIAEPQYLEFNRKLQLALNPPANRDEAESGAREDWARDLRRSKHDANPLTLDLQSEPSLRWSCNSGTLLDILT